ncbi:hypothetical protein N7519_005038 [Penicillium mononematosum]|uniref:uncharacterized protein n=1 Tax=Penicillium mononematosum TaxID=268346 RepID=UPI0025467A1E|nr:uncharacterized protein N7519_005038 [Penicillium mononematosum]KAJ6183737.1 hypothetical protein N7519_005038 [Penicillium mononematosum]
MPGDKDRAAEWCTHCNAGGHTLPQCEYFAHYTRGIAIAMHAIAQNSNIVILEKSTCHPRMLGSFIPFDPSMHLTCANDVYLDNSKTTGSKSPVRPSTNTTNAGK